MDSSNPYLVYAVRQNNFLHDFSGKWILSLQLYIGKQAKGKSSYLKGVIMLPTINCDITKAATNVTVDFSLIHKKWRKYPVTLDGFFENTSLQDTVSEHNLYLITK